MKTAWSSNNLINGTFTLSIHTTIRVWYWSIFEICNPISWQMMWLFMVCCCCHRMLIDISINRIIKSNSIQFNYFSSQCHEFICIHWKRFEYYKFINHCRLLSHSTEQYQFTLISMWLSIRSSISIWTWPKLHMYEYVTCNCISSVPVNIYISVSCGLSQFIRIELSLVRKNFDNKIRSGNKSNHILKSVFRTHAKSRYFIFCMHFRLNLWI